MTKNIDSIEGGLRRSGVGRFSIVAVVHLGLLAGFGCAAESAGNDGTGVDPSMANATSGQATAGAGSSAVTSTGNGGTANATVTDVAGGASGTAVGSTGVGVGGTQASSGGATTSGAVGGSVSGGSGNTMTTSQGGAVTAMGGANSGGSETAMGQAGAMTSPGGAASQSDGGAGGEMGAMGMAGAPGGGGMAQMGGGDLGWQQATGVITAVRYYSGSTPSNRTSGPMQGPTQEFTLANSGAAAASVEVSLSGADAEFFELVAPANSPVDVAAGADLGVSVRVVTDNGALGAAPAQDDGATVLEANLTASVGGETQVLSLYSLVLTYVELEPTFGQIMGAFPEYTVNLGNALQNDANPNPGTLPGVEAGTDEVAAQVFQRADAGQPVTFEPLARFSPPGLVPYGYYTPGNTGAKTLVGTMAEQSDAHTNNKSRMINPPLASGGTEFDPGSNPFSLYMEPDGAAAIYSQDGQNSDGQHRVKVFELSDASGTQIPNTYLVAGEEASNGDYQDYVMVIRNVTPQ